MIRTFSSVTGRLSLAHQKRNNSIFAAACSSSSTSTIHVFLFGRGGDSVSHRGRDSIRNSIRNSSSCRNDSDYNDKTDFHRAPSLGVKTEWVKVMGTPPLSTLDDLLVDIERIMNTELNTGIVDLDAAEKLLLDQIETELELWDEEESGPEPTSKASGEDRNEGESCGDERVEGPVFGDGSLPLWIPPADDENRLPPHMVLEARMLVSSLYRQAGWFLRFPNRSCVHALLSHIDEAQKIREGERKNRKKMYRTRRKESKRKLMALGEEEGQTNPIDEQDHEENLEVPEFSWINYDTRPLLCGWKEVQVHPLYLKKGKLRTSKCQEWIDETVIRVENCPLESTADDLSYFFNSFALKDERSFLDDNEVEPPSSWTPPSGKQWDSKAIQLVVSGERAGSEKEQALLNQDRNYTPIRTNTFLVKFASPNDARAAVAQKQNVEFMGRKVRLAQFSRQIS